MMEENGCRPKSDMYKPAHSQPQSMKHIMAILAERDAAIQERNMAINQKNKACEQRDLAVMQRDTAIQERNEAAIERENALAALHFRHNSINRNNSCPPGGVKHMHHPQQLAPQSPLRAEASYDARDVPVPDAPSSASVPTENVKSSKIKRAKDPDAISPNKKTSHSTREVKREGEDQEWKEMLEMVDGDGYKQLAGAKADWKGSDLGLNHVAFDESTMPPPVCSCTGTYRQCYKWGNGGWQSSCCTMTMSMHPLPAVPNKKHARVGGRKMSGSVFSKLLSRLAGEGHDLSTPIDLKDHWAKHGTNRYITIR